MEMVKFAADAPPVLLIIDDTAANLGVIASHLEDRGFDIVIAQSGEDGIRRAQRTAPDLILLDVMMPGIDGFETCRRLKAMPATADIPVIFMTALSDTSDKVTGFEAGGVDYVTKPIQIAEVLVRINTHLGLRAARRELAQRNAVLQDLIETRRKAELALKSSNKQLASTIATLEKTQGQLVLSAKLAGLGALVSGIAHELNTPIGTAMLTASSLQEDIHAVQALVPSIAGNPTLTQTLHQRTQNLDEGMALLGRSLSRAGELIRKFRLVAVDQMSKQTQHFELHQLVSESVQAFQAKSTQPACPIEVSVPPSITLNGYPNALEQVLTQLLCNAFSHALDAKHMGRVKIDGIALDDDWIKLTVSDDGKGIAPDHLGKIFDPFYTTRLGQGGSGFGLYAVYNQVNYLMGGRIHVESTLGQGTRITMKLPRNATADGRHPA
jgi:signal transduction histidine kinase